MAKYCFIEGSQSLFTEASIRGWLAGVLDFPHLKDPEEIIELAQAIPDELRADVCCIPGDDAPYRKLTVTAWVAAYQAFVRDVSLREKVLMASVLKKMSLDEALGFLRHAITNSESQDAIDAAYTQYQAFLCS